MTCDETVGIKESEQALRDYRVSDVARGIPGVYQVQGTPRIEEFEMAVRDGRSQ